MKSLQGEAWLQKKIRHRLLHKELNWLAVWTGPPGSGKSWSALRVAELIDEDFSIERVGFDVDSILEKVWEWKLPRGSAIMLDEAGLAIDSRRWFEHANQALAYMIESFRYLGLAFLMTVPDPSFIDRVPRTLFNMSFDCLMVDRAKELVVARPYRHQINPRLQKVYHKGPKMRVAGKGWVKVRTIRFRRPTATLTNAYEGARHEYMQTFHGELLRRGRDMAVENMRLKDRVSTIVEGINRLNEQDRHNLRNSRGSWDPDLIQLEFDTSRSVARTVSKILARESQ